MRFLPIAVRVAPPAVWRWILERLPSKRVRHVLALVDNLSATSKQILAEKKLLLAKGNAAVGSQVGEGKDVMSVLCTFHSFDSQICSRLIQLISVKANMDASAEDKMTDDELEGHIA